MWDEEDLEPLGGANSASINCNSQHIEEFDSEVNSSVNVSVFGN